MLVNEEADQKGCIYNLCKNSGKVSKKEAAFYAGKVWSAKFFIETIPKRTKGKIEGLKSDTSPVLEIADKSFGE